MRVVERMYVFLDYFLGRHEQRVGFRKKTKDYRVEINKLNVDLRGEKASYFILETEYKALQEKARSLEDSVFELVDERGNALNKAHQAERKLEDAQIKYQQAEQNHQAEVKDLEHQLELQKEATGHLDKKIREQRRELEGKVNQPDFLELYKLWTRDEKRALLFLDEDYNVVHQNRYASKLIKGRIKNTTLTENVITLENQKTYFYINGDYFVIKKQKSRVKNIYLATIRKSRTPEFLLSQKVKELKRTANESEEKLKKEARKMVDEAKQLAKEYVAELEVPENPNSHDGNVPLGDS